MKWNREREFNTIYATFSLITMLTTKVLNHRKRVAEKKTEEKKVNRKFKNESRYSNGCCNKRYSFQGGLSTRVWGVGDAGLTAAHGCYNPGGREPLSAVRAVPAWVVGWGLTHTGCLYSALCRLGSGWENNSRLILQKASNVTISR